MPDTSLISEIIGPYWRSIVIVLGALSTGFIFEKLIFMHVARIVEKTKWRGDDLLLNSFRGMTTLWFLLAGLYFGIQRIESISPATLSISKTVLIVLAVLSATIVVSKIITKTLQLYNKRHQGRLPSTSLFANVANMLVFVIGALVILQTLGISIAPLLTALGVGGLAVALGLQETLGNLFAGIQLIVSRLIDEGDYIKLDSGEEGYVTDITWRNTTIETRAKNLIIVPNAKLAKSIVTNFTKPLKEYLVLIPVGVHYSSDLEKVEKITNEIITATLKQLEPEIGSVTDFTPLVRYTSFGDSAIQITVVAKVPESGDQFILKHVFIKALKKRFDDEGIVIAFPMRQITGSITVQNS